MPSLGVARTSTTSITNRTLYFTDLYILSSPFQCWNMIENTNISSYFFPTIQHVYSFKDFTWQTSKRPLSHWPRWYVAEARVNMMTSSNGNIFHVTGLCAENSPVTGEFSAERPVTRSFAVFFDLCLNKRLSKQSWGWWSETPSCSLWRHCNEYQT